MSDWSDKLFLVVNASDHPVGAVVVGAKFMAADLVFLVTFLLIALWVWGNRQHRAGLVASVCATALALTANQIMGLLWYEPRPFMIGLGHTLAAHVPENSFPSDHATFMWTVGLSLIITRTAWRWGIAVVLAGVLVAWARIYLGLHFPVDMLSSALIAVVFSFASLLLQKPLDRFVVPMCNRLYDTVLDVLRFPKWLFPRTLN